MTAVISPSPKIVYAGLLKEASREACSGAPGRSPCLAPTDEAFATIPKADLNALMKDQARLAER